MGEEAFSSDYFRMYEFKVKRCPRARPHDWTQVRLGRHLPAFNVAHSLFVQLMGTGPSCSWGGPCLVLVSMESAELLGDLLARILLFLQYLVLFIHPFV